MVGPELRKRCRFLGSQVALELVDFSEATNEVWAEARRRGALRLSGDKPAELEDWINVTVLRAEAEFRPDVLAHRDVVDRVCEDIARTEEEWRKIWERGDE